MTEPSLRVSATRMLLPGGRWSGPGTLVAHAGRITALEDGPAAGGTLTPGLLDVHNNGAFGVDFATADPAEWRYVLSRLAAHGVTAVQPTAITAPLPELRRRRGHADRRRVPSVPVQ